MVYSDLGEVTNGNIGLILYLEKYNVISIMKFIHPLHPRPLVIIDVTTQLIVNEMQEQHK